MAGRRGTKRIAAVNLCVCLAIVSLSCARQPEFETRLASVGQAEIEYVVSGSEDRDPVLLIHGGMLGTAFALVQEATALDSYRVFRIHRRGFVGSSDADSPMSATDGAADVVAVMDTIRLERAHIVGHSAGGAMAMQIAIDASERVRTLSLIEPPALPQFAPSFLQEGAPRPASIDAAEQSVAAGDAEGALKASAAFVFGDDWREYFDAVPGGYAQALADILRSQPAAPPWELPEIAAIDQPTLVLWGEESPAAGMMAALTEALPQADGRAIEGADHALITQKPNEVAEALANFFGRHPI